MAPCVFTPGIGYDPCLPLDDMPPEFFLLVPAHQKVKGFDGRMYVTASFATRLGWNPGSGSGSGSGSGMG